ncbi:hypothetical protein [Acidovorax sp.]|uniref:hypothetical protein n=1 Tax=Acidovorax sp. TaxID=1872122 RepID=UPI00391F1C35
MSIQPRARLLAIVSVEPANRVQCQQPGCGHGVYAAIHVVDDGGQLIVMGSTCFARRFGGLQALGRPAYAAGGGGGHMLSDQDRELLASNTADLIEEFKKRHELAMAQAEARLRAIQERMQAARPVRHSIFAASPAMLRPPQPNHPWPWQHPKNSSVGLMRSPSGHAWVRIQHHDGSQKIAPWPSFAGWENVLPAALGTPDMEIQAYSVPDVVRAVMGLRAQGFTAPEVTRWPDVLKLVKGSQGTS